MVAAGGQVVKFLITQYMRLLRYLYPCVVCGEYGQNKLSARVVSNGKRGRFKTLGRYCDQHCAERANELFMPKRGA